MQRRLGHLDVLYCNKRVKNQHPVSGVANSLHNSVSMVLSVKRTVLADVNCSVAVDVHVEVCYMLLATFITFACS